MVSLMVIRTIYVNVGVVKQMLVLRIFYLLSNVKSR